MKPSDIRIGTEPAPRILVDGYWTAGVANGVARFLFFTTGYDRDGVIQHPSVDLQMPVSTVVAVHHAMGEMIAALRQNGTIVGPDESSEKPN